MDRMIGRLAKAVAKVMYHVRGSGMYMLRRLFLSPALIASYSPEPPQHHEGREASY